MALAAGERGVGGKAVVEPGVRKTDLHVSGCLEGPSLENTPVVYYTSVGFSGEGVASFELFEISEFRLPQPIVRTRVGQQMATVPVTPEAVRPGVR